MVRPGIFCATKQFPSRINANRLAGQISWGVFLLAVVVHAGRRRPGVHLLDRRFRFGSTICEPLSLFYGSLDPCNEHKQGGHFTKRPCGLESSGGQIAEKSHKLPRSQQQHILKVAEAFVESTNASTK